MRLFASRFWLVFLLGGVAALGILTLWLVEPRVGRLWVNTAGLASGAALLALPLGTLAAVAVFKTDAPGQRLAAVLFTAMLFVPLYLVTGAWNAGFGIQGWHTLATNPHLAHDPWLEGWRAAIWVHGMAAVPWVVLIVGAGLRAVEAEMEEDAVTVATPGRVVWYVTLRRAGAALVVAAMWVAIVATVEISATDFFQVRTFAEEVYTQAALGTFDLVVPVVGEAAEPMPAAGFWTGLALSSLLALSAMVAAGALFARFTEAPHRRPWVWRLGRWRWPAAAVLWSIMLLVAGMPLGNLLYKAGVHVTATEAGVVRSWSVGKVVERVAAAPVEFRGELWLSACLGAAAATAALAIALPLAWSMRVGVRSAGAWGTGRRPVLLGGMCAGRRRPWLRMVGLALCLTIPGPLLGMGLIWMLDRPPESPLAGLAVLYDSNFAPWLVQTVRALPLVTLILWPALGSIPQVMLDAAATEGTGWWGRLLRIALPQRWPAVAAAWLVGLAIAVGELAATVLVMPPQLSTALSVRVFQLLHYGVDDRVAAICLVMVGGIAAVTGIAAALMKRNT